MQPLKPWMVFVLRFAGTFNILAGISMIVFYHEGFRLIGLTRPSLMLPTQLVGALVALFGLGYYLVANSPIENRNVLMLGMCSKALGSVLSVYHWWGDRVPLLFLGLVFFADVIYLPAFAIILRRLYRLARVQNRTSE
jgi:hypothetical protein